MKQSQYQSSGNNRNDLFEEYLDELPEQDIQVTRKVERDIERYQENKERERQKKFRIRTFAIAAAAALIINLPRMFAADHSRDRDYLDDFPDDTVEVIHYDEGDGVLDSDLKEPEILIDGEYYHFPFPVSELLDRGWEFDEEDEDVQVSRFGEFVTLVRGDERLHVVSLISPDGTPVDKEDALVTGFIFYGDDSTEVTLPDDITAGSTEEELIQAMRDSGLTWSLEEYEYDENTAFRHYTYYAPVEDEHFTYYIVEVTVYPDGTVQNADLWLVDFTYPTGIDEATNS